MVISKRVREGGCSVFLASANGGRWGRVVKASKKHKTRAPCLAKSKSLKALRGQSNLKRSYLYTLDAWLSDLMNLSITSSFQAIHLQGKNK